MKKRTFDEMISYFNRKVAEMEIDRKYKMELLGMITAILQEHDSSVEPERTGKWIYAPDELLGYVCSVCKKGCCRFNYCPHCGAKMEVRNEEAKF